MPLSTIAYTCGLCGKPGEAKYQSEMVHRLERWTPMLHCNRCADFKVMLRKLRENCKNLTILRWNFSKNGKLTKEREDRIQSEVTDLTKAISKLVCVHWRVDTVWTPDFVDQLIDYPDKAEFIVNQYANMIKEMAQQVHEQALMPV